MKKRCVILAILLALVFAFSGCSAVMDQVFGSGDGLRPLALTEGTGYTMQVPQSWIVTQSVVKDGEGFTYLSSATFSNSAKDKSGISLTSYQTEETPEQVFDRLYQAQGLSLKSQTAPEKSDKYALGENESRRAALRYLYKAEDKTGNTTHVMQLLCKAEGRVYVFTYTAPDQETFDAHYATVDTVAKTFSTAKFDAPRPLVGEGMVPLTRKDTAGFSLSAPAGWYQGTQGETGYVKAISPDGTLTVNATAFIPNIKGSTLKDYWNEEMLPKLAGTFGDSLVIEESGETAVKCGEETGARFLYKGTAKGVDYHFMQIYFADRTRCYVITFASLSPIDPAGEEVLSILATFDL